MTGYPSIDKPWMKYYTNDLNFDIPQLTMYENMYSHNLDNLDGIALEYYGNTKTYKEMFEEINNIAFSLLEIGVLRGDIVGVCSLDSIDTIELIYAINKIGAVAKLISGLTDLEGIRVFLSDTELKYLFVEDIFYDSLSACDKVSGINKIVLLNITNSMGKLNKYAARLFKGLSLRKDINAPNTVSWFDFYKKSTANIENQGEFSDIALICYTGGSTGGSKGVLLTNYAVNSVCEQYIHNGANVKKGQTWLNYIPSFVAFGMVASIHLGLIGGNQLILRIPGSENMGVGLRKYKVNHAVYGPYFWEQLAKEDKPLDLSGMVEPTSGGDKLALAVEELINDYLKKCGSPYPLLNGYGMTETAAAVTVNTLIAHKVGSIGIPFCKNIVAAFDTETMAELRYGEEGEICILTSSMMKGYVNRPEETAQVLRVHSDGNTWVHTGDLGYVDKDGFVFISGRLKRFFLYKRTGYVKKVFSLEIEKKIVCCANVEKCAVVPISDERFQQVPVAFVIPNTNVSDAELISELTDLMSNEDESFRPRKYIIISEFPLTAVSKVDYLALEKMAAEKCDDFV